MGGIYACYIKSEGRLYAWEEYGNFIVFGFFPEHGNGKEGRDQYGDR